MVQFVLFFFMSHGMDGGEIYCPMCTGGFSVNVNIKYSVTCRKNTTTLLGWWYNTHSMWTLLTHV